MSIDNEAVIEVLNYEGQVILPASSTKPEGLLIDKGELNNPTIEPMLFRDIKVANSKTDFFKIGRLRFNPIDEKKVYEALRITDIDNIFSEKEIRELLQKPEKETFEKIIKVKSTTLIIRMKKVLFSMGMAKIDVSSRIVSCLNKRNEELKFNPNASSKLTVEEFLPEKQLKENEMKKQLEQQKDIFEDMMKKMEQQLTSRFESQIDTMKSENNKIKQENEDLKKQLKDTNTQVEEKKTTTKNTKTATKPKK